jgi:hypothetical protein
VLVLVLGAELGIQEGLLGLIMLSLLSLHFPTVSKDGRQAVRQSRRAPDNQNKQLLPPSFLLFFFFFSFFMTQCHQQSVVLLGQLAVGLGGGPPTSSPCLLRPLLNKYVIGSSFPLLPLPLLAGRMTISQRRSDLCAIRLHP